MSTTLRRIEKKLRQVRARIAQARLARLPEQLQHHASTGEEPTEELSKAYLKLTRTALAAMDGSVGGGDSHTQALAEYEQALAEWKQALKANGL